MTQSTKKNSVTIRLTESVVFLRSIDFTGGRRSYHTVPTSMLRGLLVLNLTKPTRISNIEVELIGKAWTSWPEGVGARRIDVSEEHKIFTSSITFFEAKDSKHNRRTASVGPGVALYDDDDAIDLTEDFHTSTNAQDHPRPSRIRPSIGGGSSTQRTLSSGHHPYHHSDYHYATRQSSVEDETPPYTPNPSFMGVMHSPGSATPPIHRRDDTAAEALEEFRQALRLDLENEHHRSAHGTFSPQAVASSSSSIHSFVDYSPRRHSIEDVPEEPATVPQTQESPPLPQEQYHSPRTSRAVTPSPGTRTPESPGVGHPPDHTRGRHHARFSLSTVIDSVKDRMRSSSPRTTTRDRTMSRDRTIGRDGHATELEARGRRSEKGKEKDRTQTPSTSRTTFAKIHDMLKLDGEEHHHKDHGEGWQEFKKGIYTYPISIPVPGDAPPTLECEHGSMTWRLRARVHRPGVFTSSLQSTREVVIVACPDDDDTENNEAIIVERQWDNQLQYLINVSGRSFYIGGVIPMHVALMPLAKAKVHRITVLLEEKTDYYTQFKRLVRSEVVRHPPLLSIRHPNKDGGPILPLESDDPEAFRNSPLHVLLGPGDDPSEMASSLMGPGPWTFSQEVPLPSSCNSLQVSTKNRKSNITITHTLKVIFRVERGDDSEVDPKTGKKKLYDIVMQTPVHILSCRCSPEWTSLPKYTEDFEESVVKAAPCPCAVKRRSGHHANNSDVNESPPTPSTSRITAHLDRTMSRRSTDSASTASTSSVNAPMPLPSTALRRVDSLVNRNVQFERLVSGQESETGDAPPPYRNVVGSTS